MGWMGREAEQGEEEEEEVTEISESCSGRTIPLIVNNNNNNKFKFIYSDSYMKGTSLHLGSLTPL